MVHTMSGLMVKARQFRPQMEGAIGGQTEGETITSTTEDQGVPSEERTVVIYMVGASKHADKVEAFVRNNGRSIHRRQYDNAETFKQAINTDCSLMIVLIEEQFSKLLEDEYRNCKSALKDLVEAGKDVLLISYLDDDETHQEVYYKLPNAMRNMVVHHTLIPNSTNGYVVPEDRPTTAAEAGNNNHIEVIPGADSIDARQVGRNDTFSASSDHPTTAAQAGNNNHIEVIPGTDSIDARQVGRNSTFSASSDHPTTATQVGNNNHIEVKPGANNIRGLQVGRNNTFSASSDHPTTAAQVGNNNHIEVIPDADNIGALQVGRNNTFSTSSGPLIQGYKLTVTTPEADYELCAEIKKHIDSNIDDINISLKPLNTRVESTSLGSVIINVTVEPGIKLGPVWLREVITKILSEDIFAKLPKGTRMGVCISASLPLTPLDVNIFELKGEKWITDYTSDITRKDGKGRSMLHQAARFGNRSAVILSLKSGCIVDDQDRRGNTALHYAALLEENSASVSGVLTEGGASIGAVNRDGYTPLHCAVAMKNLEVVELFVERFGVKESNPTSSNPTDISYLTQLIVRQGADVNALNKEQLTPLHVAASSQSFDVMKVLLTEGADANVGDKNGQTPLHHVFGSNLETGAVTETYRPKKAPRKRYVGPPSVDTDKPDDEGARKAPSSVFDIPDSEGNTPLHSALKANFTQGAITLVNGGSSVKTKNNVMDTALHILARNTNLMYPYSEIDAVMKVIECSRDVNVKDNSGNTPLMMAVKMNKDISPLLKTGADVNAKNKHGDVSLIIAVQRDNLKMVETLIKAGSDVNTRNSHGDTALMIAVERECKENVSAILKSGADVNASNTCGETAVHQVAEHAISKQAVHARRNVEEKGKTPSSPFDTDIVETLLKAGANINARDHKGKTPLMTATAGISKEREGESNLIPQLINWGANVNAQDLFGQTPLMMAVEAGHDISPLLTAGAHVNSKDISGKTALHLVYEDYYHPHKKTKSMYIDRYNERRNNNASRLIAAGADVNAQDDDGNSPLMMAVKAGCDISPLLKAGADVNSKNKSGKTALHLVSEDDCDFGTMTISQPIAARADVNAEDDDGNSPPMMAVKAGRDISPLLKAGAGVKAKDISGKTALHLVSEDYYPPHKKTKSMYINRYNERRTNNASRLIAAGADVNAQDGDSNTPLMMAVKAGHDISPLLKAGADVNSKNISGKTALHLVSEDDCDFGKMTISQLIAAGADVNAQDDNGNTPLHVCVQNTSYGNAMELLRNPLSAVNIRNRHGQSVSSLALDAEERLSPARCMTGKLKPPETFFDTREYFQSPHDSRKTAMIQAILYKNRVGNPLHMAGVTYAPKVYHRIGSRSPAKFSVRQNYSSSEKMKKKHAERI